MKKKNKTAIAAVLIIMITLMSSCAMKQEVFVDKNGAGSVDFEINLASYFTEVAVQLSDLVPSGNQDTIKEGQFFNLKKIEDDFAKRSSVTLTSLESPRPESLKGTFTFSDINDAVTDAGKTKNPGIFTFASDSGVSILTVSLNCDTIEQLLNENPSLNNPLMENFGPLANKDLSETDYLDMMEYMLGEESRQGIIDSVVDITVRVKGKIVSQTGGEKLSSDSVRFRIPLIKILVLNKPLNYEVKFK